MYKDICYDGEHSVTFFTLQNSYDPPGTARSKNTWEDWKLAPSSRPVIKPPTPKRTTIDIPGANGLINLSGSLTGGRPIYNNREGSMEFIVVNGYGRWNDRLSAIMNFLDAPNTALWLDDDSYEYKHSNGSIDRGVWYYVGAVWVSDWTSNNDGTWSTITFDYSVKPHKQRWIMDDDGKTIIDYSL